MMKAIKLGFILIFTSLSLFASSQEMPLFQPKIEVSDQASLQRGAAFYMNYCSGCHSLQYLRYDKMARDLGLTTFDGDIDYPLLQNNLIFTEAKPIEAIDISMPKADARAWFGVVPPDLSLKARERGADWLYTYLDSFYADSRRPFGANNLLKPDVSMPNVLLLLKGHVVKREGPTGEPTLVVTRPGSMSEAEYHQALTDLVTFLVYVSEPVQLTRYRIGYGVMAFLFVFLILTYRLKKAYWKKL